MATSFTDEYSTIINHNYYILLYLQGRLQLPLLDNTLIIMSPLVKHDAVSEQDSWLVLVGPCNDPGWTMTKGR